VALCAVNQAMSSRYTEMSRSELYEQVRTEVDGVKSAFDSRFSNGVISPLETEAFPKKRLIVGDRA
jgi:hypothetical protein